MGQANFQKSFGSRKIMIAEDDLDDQFLIQEAFEQSGVKVSEITFVNDGQELLTALQESNEPDIILLDLNMPRKDGREALLEIKNNAEFKHIPVIVFTTSSEYDDVRLTYENGGNTFLTKPNRYEELLEVVGLIKSYWFEKAKLAELT